MVSRLSLKRTTLPVTAGALSRSFWPLSSAAAAAAVSTTAAHAAASGSSRLRMTPPPRDAARRRAAKRRAPRGGARRSHPSGRELLVGAPALAEVGVLVQRFDLG